MKRPTIVLDLQVERQTQGWQAPLAGGSIWCDRPVLPGWRPARRPESCSIGREGRLRTVYAGPGLVAGRVEKIVCRVGRDRLFRVEYEDGEVFRVARAGCRVERWAGSPSGPPTRETVERAVGAPLVVALAEQGVHVLHASALRTGSGVVALTAESGAGKSTLAAAAAADPSLGLVRIADDQLPVALGPSPRALPHFPQLKLPRGAAYGEDEPAELPLAALVELVGETGRRRAEVERMTAADACLAFVRATVAVRLFDPRLLAAHLAVCSVAAERLPVFRLTFPWGLDCLEQPLAAVGELVEVVVPPGGDPADGERP